MKQKPGHHKANPVFEALAILEDVRKIIQEMQGRYAEINRPIVMGEHKVYTDEIGRRSKDQKALKAHLEHLMKYREHVKNTLAGDVPYKKHNITGNLGFRHIPKDQLAGRWVETRPGKTIEYTEPPKGRGWTGADTIGVKNK